ncbi:MAG: LysM peptidoglycan-binding domain-containing protein [bacterium]
MKKLFALYMIGAFLLFINTSGCALLKEENNAWEPVKPKKLSFVHTVQWPGETLALIAKWYTGDSNNWSAIADANPIIDPDRLFIGNSIFIPNDILKTRKPLQKKFITTYNRKPKKKKIVPNPAPQKDIEDEFELFGPK